MKLNSNLFYSSFDVRIGKRKKNELSTILSLKKMLENSRWHWILSHKDHWQPILAWSEQYQHIFGLSCWIKGQFSQYNRSTGKQAKNQLRGKSNTSATQYRQNRIHLQHHPLFPSSHLLSGNPFLHHKPLTYQPIYIDPSAFKIFTAPDMLTLYHHRKLHTQQWTKIPGTMPILGMIFIVIWNTRTNLYRIILWTF